MGKHIRKQFSEAEVGSIIKRYLSGELTSELAQEFLNIKRRQFFSLLSTTVVIKCNPILHFSCNDKNVR